MQVSVIIPVYNAARYIQQAVESALAQPETAEAIVIEDGSSDNSLEVCGMLARRHDRVRLLRHPDAKNHGASASRNLGIVNARCEYIAFLDADDYLLPNRFLVAEGLFAADPELEGVYEAMGISFEDEASKERWLRVRGHAGLTTMTERVAPKDLFEKQAPIGDCGYCTTGGWVVRRPVFSKTGFFDERLRLHDDTVMFVKFAALGKMLPGRLHLPVVMRRVHATNRSSALRPPLTVYVDRVRMWATLWRWGKHSLPLSRQNLVLQRFLGYASVPCRDAKSSLGKRVWPRLQLTGLAVFYPDLLLQREFRLLYCQVMVPFGLRKVLSSIKTRLSDSR